MDLTQFNWLHAGLLGLGLAASSGLNTFLPLFLLACATHFKIGGISLGENFAWLSSNSALAALGIAAVVEVIGDKIPAVDHLLDSFGTVARPAAGALAAASVFQGDPTTAAIVGIAVGAPTAFGFHAAKATTRAGSTATTMGMGNPVLSVIEDVVAVGVSILSIVYPWLVPVAVILMAIVAWKLFTMVRKAARNARGLFQKKPEAV